MRVPARQALWVPTDDRCVVVEANVGAIGPTIFFATRTITAHHSPFLTALQVAPVSQRR